MLDKARWVLSIAVFFTKSVVVIVGSLTFNFSLDRCGELCEDMGLCLPEVATWTSFFSDAYDSRIATDEIPSAIRTSSSPCS